jgi:hypothetical protein
MAQAMTDSIQIPADQVAPLLAVIEAMMGRSVQYARQRLISLASEMESPYKEALMADIEAVFRTP